MARVTNVLAACLATFINISIKQATSLNTTVVDMRGSILCQFCVNFAQKLSLLSLNFYLDPVDEFSAVHLLLMFFSAN